MTSKSRLTGLKAHSAGGEIMPGTENLASFPVLVGSWPQRRMLYHLVLALCWTRVIPSWILNFTLMTIGKCRYPTYQRSLSLQQTKTISENHNQTQDREQQIVGNHASKDTQSSVLKAITPIEEDRINHTPEFMIKLILLLSAMFLLFIIYSF